MHALLGALLGTVLSLVTAALIGLAHIRDQSKRLKIILVGQLKNLSGHCTASVKSLQSGKRELVLRLRLAKYGPIASLNEVLTKVGHLDEPLIAELLSVSLRVRNNDLELDRALELLVADHTNIDLSGIIDRISRLADRSEALAEELKARPLPLVWPLNSFRRSDNPTRPPQRSTPVPTP
jgi:hypothetical protein